MLRLAYILIRNLVVLVLFPIYALRRSRAAPRGSFLSVTIDGPVTEIGRTPRLFRRAETATDLHRVGRSVELALRDPRVRGLLVTIRELSGGTATAAAVRELIERARAHGKQTAVYLPLGAGTREYYIASAAESVLVGPESQIAPSGFAVQVPYVRDALDRAGIQPEVVSIGRYKAAGESLLLRGMSEPQREQVGAYLDCAYDEVVGSIAEGRRVTRNVAAAWLDRGLFRPEEAISEGLADVLAHDDEVPMALSKDGDAPAPLVPSDRYLARRSPLFLPLVRPGRIAVIELRGTIVDKAKGPMPVAAQRELRELIVTTMDDPRAKAVVLYVSSRGGSALASEKITHELTRLAAKKPLVAYLGDVAASGGYMAAIAAARIVAQPATLTGSIGVVAAHLGVGALLSRIGVAIETIKRGEFADAYGPLRTMTVSERELLERHLAAAYRSFVSRVAAGRKRSVEEIEPLAEGRVYSGRKALEHGLVDDLGSLRTAIEVARSLAAGDGRALVPELRAPRGRARLASLLARRLTAPSAVVELSAQASAAAEMLRVLLEPPSASVWAYCPLFVRDLGTRPD